MSNDYEVKDSGKKSEYEDGMRRDSTDGKPQPSLMFPRNVDYKDQLLTRVAMQYYQGGLKYGPRNWEKSCSEESLAHHEDALLRHVFKYICDEQDGEDHAAAIVWNVNAVELTRRNLKARDRLEGRETAEHSMQLDLEQDEELKQSIDRLEKPEPGKAIYKDGGFSVHVNDLIFEVNDMVQDADGDKWVFFEDDETWGILGDSFGHSALNMVAKWYGPLKITSGNHAKKIVHKDGSVNYREYTDEEKYEDF